MYIIIDLLDTLKFIRFMAMVRQLPEEQMDIFVQRQIKIQGSTFSLQDRRGLLT